MSEEIKWHNPENVDPKDIPIGWRFLLPDEMRSSAKLIWAGTHDQPDEWVSVRKMDIPDFPVRKSQWTYITDLPLVHGNTITNAPPFGILVGEGKYAPPLADVVDAVLTERGASYGKFEDNSRTAQGLKRVVAEALLCREDPLPYDLAEAIDMILSKLSRMAHGSEAGWKDQLTDVEGYARLVRERIEGNAR